MEQVKHAIETGALRSGEQLPGIRPLAEELVINVNTVAKAYRELEHEGVVELRHGSGAFVADNPRTGKHAEALRGAQTLVAGTIERHRTRFRSARREHGDPAANRFRQRGERPLSIHDCGRDDPLHALILSALARRSRAEISPKV